MKRVSNYFLNPARVNRVPGVIMAATLAATLLLAGCSVLPSAKAPEASYDFGPLPTAATTALKIEKSVLVHDALSPAWLEVSAMHYRLAQTAPAQPRTYANSRWVMPPAALLTARLKSRLAEISRGVYAPVDGQRTDITLRLELEEFVQVFDTASNARGLLRVRASLGATRQAAIQKTFIVERPAATPDADGGAKALIAATDEAIAQIVAWVAANGK